MRSPESDEHYVQSLTANQGRLYRYVYSLINDQHAASDILQECNLVLWRRIDDFDPDADFIAWAFGIARFQVMAYLRDKKRREKRLLDPAVADLLHEEVASQAADHAPLHRALALCLEQLPEKSRKLMRQRYSRSTPIKELAEELGRSPSAIKVQIFRLRALLRECIEKHMSHELGKSPSS